MLHEYTGSECDTASLTLNGQPFVLDFQPGVAQTLLQVPAANRSIGISIQGYCDQPHASSHLPSRQVLFFDVDPLDGTIRDTPPSFTVILNASSQSEALIFPHPHPDTQCLSTESQIDIDSKLLETDDDSIKETHDYDSPPTTEADEFETRPNTGATELRKRFEEERKLIRRLTMDCRKPLLDEIRACNHNVTCSSQAIGHHLRDAFISIVAELRASLQNSPITSGERNWQVAGANEKFAAVSSSDSSDVADMEKKNIVVLALEILASIIGLSGLLACVRSHCRSPRRRRERLADFEEKIRAREYRRLARKEAFRRKWVAFKGVFRIPCGTLNLEEKQALVMDAAAIAVSEDMTVGDIEQAWETAFSPEYLEALARNPEMARACKTDDSRSRSDSLPPYGSDKLPDYTSQPDRPSSPCPTGCSATSAITPDSSIPDLSPRNSRETLRTYMSTGTD